MRLRLSGGALLGRNIRFSAQGAFRPTTERNRQKVFNILADLVSSARFCDLYAGSGAMGMEAMSRGAESAVFFDNARECIEIIEENLAALGLDPLCRVHHRDAGEIAIRETEPFDIIFLDPPYGIIPIRTLELAVCRLAKKGVLIHEHSSRQPDTRVTGLTLVDSRKSGDSVFAFYRLTKA